MRVTKQARRDAKELFRTCRVDGQLDEARVRLSVTAVLQRKPRGYMAILHFFYRLVKLEVERRTARVESAVPLSAELQAAVQRNLDRLYGAGLSTTYSTNGELIGGVRVHVGSDVYDGSIQGRLVALKEAF